MSTLFNALTMSTIKPIPGMLFWGNAAQTDVNATLATFKDFSGNGYDATSSGSLRPACTANQQNSKNGIVFNGANSLLISGSPILSLPNGDSTVYIVAKSSVDNAVERLLSIGTAGNNRYNTSFSSTSNQIFLNNGGSNVSVGGFTKSAANIFCSRINGTTQAISVNGGAEITDSSAVYHNDSDQATIGSTRGISQFLTGVLFEIIIYNVSHSAAQRAYNYHYLSQNWAIGHL